MPRHRTVLNVTTDADGNPRETIKLGPNQKYLICEEMEEAQEAPVFQRMTRRQDIVDWIDNCVLGDLRTLRRGVESYLSAPDAGKQGGFGGGNYLLAAACCMALDYLGQVYDTTGKRNSTDRATAYVDDFMAPLNGRYKEVFLLIWRSFRNGIIHGSWPQPIHPQGQPGDFLTVGVGISDQAPHLGPDPKHPSQNLLLNSVRFLADIERSFTDGFKNWILNTPDEGVLDRAGPQIAEIQDGNTKGVAQFLVAKGWNHIPRPEVAKLNLQLSWGTIASTFSPPTTGGDSA